MRKTKIFTFCLLFVMAIFFNSNAQVAEQNFRCDGSVGHCFEYKEVIYRGILKLKGNTLKIN